MWKTILMIIGVVLAGIAVWLLLDLRNAQSDSREIEQFIGCKTENIQLTIQYNRCLDFLDALFDSRSSGTPASSTMQGTPADKILARHSPGGMITDPDPGGMITDPDSGLFVYGPSKEKLQHCAARNLEFRTAVKACTERLNECLEDEEC